MIEVVHVVCVGCGRIIHLPLEAERRVEGTLYWTYSGRCQFCQENHVYERPHVSSMPSASSSASGVAKEE